MKAFKKFKYLTIKPQDSLRGFSLVEVLVTIVVLAVGLLGIAALQIKGIRFAHRANLHYFAILQAQDMTNRMRANLTGVNAGAYNNISSIPSDPGCITNSNGCTPAQLAVYDAFEWNTNNARLLPSGQGSVTGAGVNSVFAVTISWQEVDAAAGTPQTINYVVNFKP